MPAYPKKREIVVLFFILFFYAFLLAQPINLVTADLGRHLKNGEIFFQNFQIPAVNLYSYTQGNFPFINHHWGAGVIFYSIFKMVGFGGLSLVFLITSLATLTLFLHIAYQKAGLLTASLAALFTVPVLSSRVEIRPEFFSYFLVAVFFWILWHYQENKISERWLWLLPVLQLIWVNTHIYFFLGGVLVLAFGAENALGALRKKSENIKKFKKLSLIAVLLGLAVLLNPFGFRGAIYPLFILQNFGYRLFENQSVWFIEKLFQYPPGLYFKILFSALVLSWIGAIVYSFKKKKLFPVSLFLLSIFFGYAALTAVRNFTIFGYFALAIISTNLGIWRRENKNPPLHQTFSAAFLLIAVYVLILVINPLYWRGRTIGWGLAPGAENSVKFFLEKNLEGPIFNNYDIGSYLIYYLYPRQKVFVDNRPEAYSSSFFNEVYIPMQEDEKKWQEEGVRYNFNAIYFWRNDLTPWAQKFLVARIQDPDWAPVFVDNYAIIFLKRNERNKSLIAQYEIPQSAFRISGGRN